MEQESLEELLLYIGIGTILGVLLVVTAIIIIKLFTEEYGFISLDDSDDEGLSSQVSVDEAYREQLMQDPEFSRSQELGEQFESRYPYGSLNTQLTREQENFIVEKGVDAWEFPFDTELNGHVQGKTDIVFYGGENLVMSNLPLPSSRNTYYFEVKVTDISPNTNIYAGLATKPYPVWRMVGFNKYSIGYNTSTGYVHNSSVFRRCKLPNRCVVGDILGIGHNPRSGCTWFTFNGRRIPKYFYGFKYSLFPSISADGPCSVSVNFGQRGFVFIEANVKKWGLAPLEGTLKPPPQYGVTEGSIFLQAGESSRSQTCTCSECLANSINSSAHNDSPQNNQDTSNFNNDPDNETQNLINNGRAGSFFAPHHFNTEPVSSQRSMYPLRNCTNASHIHLNNPTTASHNGPPTYQEHDPIALQLEEAKAINFFDHSIPQPPDIPDHINSPHSHEE
ncbi:hypothetical protein BB560_006996 [Smittium megazygosporum]|uniref:B30.2/SPRY domain-containing protein n=1 Tax=Smittium megazygosporum TaxID=133381 RepID=A0A2T9XZM6_9FUNG|nr:hypothetical protein BB560_006996 [Smittium megazygosporum]